MVTLLSFPKSVVVLKISPGLNFGIGYCIYISIILDHVIKTRNEKSISVWGTIDHFVQPFLSPIFIYVFAIIFYYNPCLFLRTILVTIPKQWNYESRQHHYEEISGYVNRGHENRDCFRCASQFKTDLFPKDSLHCHDHRIFRSYFITSLHDVNHCRKTIAIQEFCPLKPHI